MLSLPAVLFLLSFCLRQGIQSLWFLLLLQQHFKLHVGFVLIWLLGGLGALLTIGVYVVQAGVLNGCARGPSW